MSKYDAAYFAVILNLFAISKSRIYKKKEK